jgi:hypothetical protein
LQIINKTIYLITKFEKQILAKIQIKVQTNNPPNGFSLSIQLPPKLISPQITIHLNITFLHEDSLLCYATGFGDISNLNEELTRVLQTYQDIPMLINHLLNNLLKPPTVEIKLEETKFEETKLEETKFDEINFEGINFDEIENIENRMLIDENVDVNPFIVSFSLKFPLFMHILININENIDLYFNKDMMISVCKMQGNKILTKIRFLISDLLDQK